MNKKKLIAILTLLCFMFTLMPVAAFANATVSRNLVVDGKMTVNETVVIDGNVTISGGGTIERGENFTGALIKVPMGSSLTLENITIDGKDIAADKAAIEVYGELTLNSGAIVQKNNRVIGKNNEDWLWWDKSTADKADDRPYVVGGGISVIGGCLTTNDGAKVNNNILSVSDKMTAEGAETSATSDGLGAGIGLYEASSFIMNGGEISYNESRTTGTARAMGGAVGAVSHFGYSATNIIIKDGNIKNNIAMSSGGGMYLTSDCSSADQNSAMSVKISGGTFKDNKADQGGGVLVYGSNLKLSGDVVIQNNTAEGTNGRGGGLNIGSHSTAVMSGGKIVENKTSAAQPRGGGIFIAGNANVEISNVEISKNTSSYIGAGIYGGDKTNLIISGTTKIDGNIINSTIGESAGSGIYMSGVDSTLVMNNGTISNNETNVTSETEDNFNGYGAVYMANGKFIMNDGFIENNKVVLNKKNASANVYGAGVTVRIGENNRNKFTFAGGEIKNNIATANGKKGYVYGAGISIGGKGCSEFEMGKNAIISGNKATSISTDQNGNANNISTINGSGLYFKQGTHEENSGAINIAGKIENNTASISNNNSNARIDIYGVGAYFSGTDKTIINLSGTVIGNKGTGTGACKTLLHGGGVCSDVVTLFVTGEVSDNKLSAEGTASGSAAEGAGISLGWTDTTKLKLGGAPVVTGNTANDAVSNVLIRSTGQKITLAGALEAGASVGITNTKPTNGNPVQITTAETDTTYYETSAKYFVSDMKPVKGSYVAIANSTGKYVELALVDDTYYKVTLDLANVIETNGALVTNVKEGETYTAILTAATGYTLPETVTDATLTDGTLTIVNVTEDTTIAVAGVPNEYTINFDGNGATSGSTTAQAMTYDLAANLNENGFVKTGYNFAGWSTTSNDICKYPDQASVKNLTAEKDGEVTLYAVWTNKQVVPAFDGAVQSYIYNGTAKAYSITTALDNFEITYMQDGTTVEKPTDVGSYDVVITRAEDADYAAFSQTIKDGLVIKNRISGGGGFSGSYNYPVSTPTVDNGSVKLSDNNASAGETVKATVKPDNGYGVAEVIVTDEKGNVIPVTFLGNGEYSFVMPAGKVNIETIIKPAITLTVGDKDANVFGKDVKNDVAPIIVGSRTMLPIRFVAEALSATVDWNEATQTVTIEKDGVKVQIIIGADYAYINGEKVKLDAPAFIENGRTYLPLRFVAEALGADVNWDAVTQQIVIIK